MDYVGLAFFYLLVCIIYYGIILSILGFLIYWTSRLLKKKKYLLSILPILFVLILVFIYVDLRFFSNEADLMIFEKEFDFDIPSEPVVLKKTKRILGPEIITNYDLKLDHIELERILDIKYDSVNIEKFRDSIPEEIFNQFFVKKSSWTKAQNNAYFKSSGNYSITLDFENEILRLRYYKWFTKN